MTCKDCAFYNADYHCRRYPNPIRKSPEDWCGEWKDQNINSTKPVLKLTRSQNR